MLNGQSLERMSCAKDLGVFLDARLSFYAQLDNVVARCSHQSRISFGTRDPMICIIRLLNSFSDIYKPGTTAVELATSTRMTHIRH